MNKNRIDKNIGKAYEVLQKPEIGIAVDGKVMKSYRSQISSFGAAISSGSLLAAIAFFSDDGKAAVSREKLMCAIMELVRGNAQEEIAEKNLFFYVKKCLSSGENVSKVKEKILDYAIAIKLAMNLYVLIDDNENEEGVEE